MSPVPADASTSELVDEIDEIRQRLGATIDEIVNRTSPKNVVRRQVDRTKAHFVDEDGSARIENIVPVVTITVAIVGGLLVIRQLLR